LIQWLCRKKNGFFVESPEKEKVISQNLMPATNLIVQEFADLLSVVACAATDNHVNEAEAVRIRKRWEKLKTVTETFVHCCENGNFAKIQEEAKVVAHSKSI